MTQHHQPGHDAERLWLSQLEQKVAALRDSLRPREIADVARRSGAAADGGLLRLQMLFDDLMVDTNGYIVTDTDGSELDAFRQSLVLTYLDEADGGPPAERWVTFRDLPNGSFYNQAFQRYAPDRLVARWGLEPAGFDVACRALGGRPIDLGDAAYAFTVLPRIDMAAVYWLGDEDFPSRASLHFDANAHFHMVVDGLAILGSQLVSRILAEG